MYTQKEEIKLSLFLHDVIISVGNYKECSLKAKGGARELALSVKCSPSKHNDPSSVTSLLGMQRQTEPQASQPAGLTW